ncbi:NADH-quinone oxidoreductase subunit 5 family protein [Saccharothrix obliqua]|uniref:NADH-quinone oxidoreductase subunit 5 family protein n=1 Tax=Saccharothrix obliqua TaxID=2861747 RepID=UPI001C5F86DA|nr:proton-conducting transporter membrane subunit [Saccharothrix obliqua]MBW4718666.1 NADH-quinone oxidoreductase subunit L [Saccharothrix obliqua]
MLWALVAVPLVAGTALASAGRRADRVAPAVACGVAALVLVSAVGVAVGRPATSAPLLSGLRFGLAVDGLSAVMVVTVAGVLLAVVVHAAGEIRAEQARFFGLLLVFAGAMLVTVTATTVPALLMAWEVMGAASYALIGFRWRDEHRVTAGTVAFLTTRAADLGLYLAAGAVVAGGSGAAELAGLADLSGGWRDVAAAGLVVAALGKSAQLPFSFWLSRAMAGPGPVSALLHSATMVAAGAYLLLRVEPLVTATGWAGPVVAWTGAATALALGAVAVVQRDLKQLLAASTCAQIGFAVLAAGVGGGAAGTGQLVAHAATKSLLFLCAGAWLTAWGTKDLHGLRGVARRHKVVGVAFTAGALALAGVPPLSIWFTKDAVLGVAAHHSSALYVVGLAAAVMSGLYAGRALWSVWGPSPAHPAFDTEERGTRTVTVLQQAPLPVLAVAAAGLGLVLGSGDASGRDALLSGVIAVGAVALARPAGDALTRTSGPLADWLGLEAVARRFVGRPALAVADRVAWFDDRFVAGGVRLAARAGDAAARVADVRVDRWVDGVVRRVADVARALGRAARRPQTGQLHHYYAQAVVGLAVLVVLAIVVGRG